MYDDLERMVDELCDTYGDSRVIAVNARIMEMLESAHKMGYGDASCKLCVHCNNLPFREPNDKPGIG